MTDSEKISKALEKLGKTPRQVYLSLKKQGIKGRPDNCKHCPVAKFLAQETKLEVIKHKIDLPTHIIKFIEHFDKGKFPDLVIELQ